MTLLLRLIGCLGACLCTAGLTQAQTNYSNSEVAKVPCGYTTHTYKFPAGLKTYECCSPSDPQVIAPAPAKKDLKGPVTEFFGSGAMATTSKMLSTCTDLSTLSAAEKLKRFTTVYKGTCNSFAVYEHIVCSCSNSCKDVTFNCECPGVPFGELPDVSQPDSLGSKPELIGTVVTPCGRLSTCE